MSGKAYSICISKGPETKTSYIMKTKLNNNGSIDKLPVEKEQLDLPGYPLYPPEDDIYYVNERADDVDPEDPTKKKKRYEVPDTMDQKDFKDDMSGSDLDIPGAELDDDQEDIGSEDEENNYYSQADDEDADDIEKEEKEDENYL